MPVNEKLQRSIVSRETMDRAKDILDKREAVFSHLTDRWLWWNRSVNLFSRNTTKVHLNYHIWHSLLLFSHFPSISQKTKTVVDAGSGGGLPGLPMAIAYPGIDFILVDKVKKKQLVLRDIARTLSLNNVKAVHDKIENITLPEKTCVVSKHAFDTSFLLGCLNSHSAIAVMLLKGEDVFEELDKITLEAAFSVHVDRIDETYSDFFKDKYIVTFRYDL